MELPCNKPNILTDLDSKRNHSSNNSDASDIKAVSEQPNAKITELENNNSSNSLSNIHDISTIDKRDNMNFSKSSQLDNSPSKESPVRKIISFRMVSKFITRLHLLILKFIRCTSSLSLKQENLSISPVLLNKNIIEQ